jgi:hypothetical protein
VALSLISGFISPGTLIEILEKRGPSNRACSFSPIAWIGIFFFFTLRFGRIYKVMTVIEVLNKLKSAGFPDPQAEAIVEAFEARDRLWFEIQFANLRAEIERLKGEFRTEIEKLRGELRGELKDAKFQMIFWIVGSVIVGTLISHFWK